MFILLIGIFYFLFIKITKNKIYNLGRKRHEIAGGQIKELQQNFESIKFIKLRSFEKKFTFPYSNLTKNFSQVAYIHGTLSELPKISLEILFITSLSLAYLNKGTIKLESSVLDNIQPDVVIIDGESEYTNTIFPGGVGINFTDPFEVSISTDINIGDVELILNVTADGVDGYEYHTDIPFEILVAINQDGFPILTNQILSSPVLADLDGDGDQDLILGNQGLNLHYKPTEYAPMRMYINDYDNNGTIEQIVTVQENGGDYPIHQKRELTEQLPLLKKQNLKASDYAHRTIHQLFPKEVMDKSIVKKAETSASVIAINEGNGKFSIKNLPPRVQLSCVCDITCTDVNQDGNLDLIMAGNNYEFKPQFSRLDASQGNLLLGDGKMGFTWQDYETSGFKIRDEVKYLKQFKDKNGKIYVIAAVNNNKPKIFVLNE